MHGTCIFNKYINDITNYINGNQSKSNLSKIRTYNEDCDSIMQINQIVQKSQWTWHLHVWRHSVMVVASTRYPLHKVQQM